MKRQSTALILFAVLALLLAGCMTDGTATKLGSAPGQTPTPTQPVPTVMVLDASDSMNTADAPGPRIDAAKTAVRDLADALDPKTQFGVVAFGSQLPAKGTPQDRACTDVTTPIPLGPLDKEAIGTALDGIRAQGFTPIGNALAEAGKQLPTSGAASIVLISDGEPTCAPDPCATAKQIHSDRPDVTISAVGFRTDNAALQCIAADGGGLFVTADNAAQLSARLSAAQNARETATRLSTTSRGDIAIGQQLDDIRRANPSFPATGTKQVDRTIYVWEDCSYAFDGSGKLVEIAPGDPPGSTGTTIDGVAKGTPGTRAIELYGDAWEDAGGIALFPADEKAGTAYKLGYEGGSSIKDGTVTTVVLCGCLPAKKPSSSSGGPEIVTVVAVGKDGKPQDGFRRGTYERSWGSDHYCRDGMGAVTTGVYLCGITADSAYACWPDRAQSELLCTFAPWQKELRVYGYSGTLPTKLNVADPNPWAIEMADGSRCVGRSGGAWGFPPAGFNFGYSCPDTTPNKMIYIRTGSELFDKSSTEWTVYYGEYGKTPSPTPVTKVYYSAAEQ